MCPGRFCVTMSWQTSLIWNSTCPYTSPEASLANKCGTLFQVRHYLSRIGIMEPTGKSNDQPPSTFWGKLKERWLTFIHGVPYVDVLIVVGGTLLALALRFT